VPRIAPRFLSACRLERGANCKICITHTAIAPTDFIHYSTAPEQNVAADCWHRTEYPERVKVEVIHSKNRETYRGYPQVLHCTQGTKRGHSGRSGDSEAMTIRPKHFLGLRVGIAAGSRPAKVSSITRSTNDPQVSSCCKRPPR
jgi:hypothetical protein